MTDKPEITKPKSGVSRRTVVKGTAWAVPAVVVASAAPAMAAGTSQCVTATFGGLSCKQPGQGQNDFGYRLQFCFANTCSVDAVIHVTSVVSNTGNPIVQPVDVTINVPANTTTPVCAPVQDLVIYCSNSSANFLVVRFTVNNGPVQTQVVPSPPRECVTTQPLCT